MKPHAFFMSAFALASCALAETYSLRSPDGANEIRLHNDLVKEFDIRYAIHNHGPQAEKMFPDVECGYEKVKDLDRRIGFCMDVGWEYACERDLREAIRKYGAI